MHVRVNDYIKIDSDDGLPPVQHLAITRTDAERLSMGPK